MTTEFDQMMADVDAALGPIVPRPLSDRMAAWLKEYGHLDDPDAPLGLALLAVEEAIVLIHEAMRPATIPEPLADIATWCREWTDEKWDASPLRFQYLMHTVADRIEAAARPDPADSPTVECTGAVRCPAATHVHGCYSDHWPDVCDQPDEHRLYHRPAEPPVAGERTGPLGLSEGDPLMWNDSPVTFIKDDRGSRLIECESEERVWVDPASTFVVEWDAQPEPGETHADIAAELRLRADAEETPPHASPYEASKLRNLADRIEAASRPDPDPDTITVNLPATNLADLVRFVERDGRSLNASVLWTLRHFQTALADRLAAAGLPQEPTEGGES